MNPLRVRLRLRLQRPLCTSSRSQPVSSRLVFLYGTPYGVICTDYRLGTRLPGYVPDHGLLVAPGLNPKGPPQPQVSRRGYDLTTGHSHLTLLPSPKPQASSILPSITDFLLLTPRRLPSSAASTVLESMCYIDVVIYDQHNKWAN